MKAVAIHPQAYKLLHEGAIVLAEIEANGMAIDDKYLRRAIKKTTREISKKRRDIQSSKVVKIWKKHFRDRTNLDSHDQLGKILFEVMGYKNPTRTKGGGYSTTEEALSSINDPFVQDFLHLMRLKKAKNTYLHGIEREMVKDGIYYLLRPHFNLNLAVSYRSSCDKPNFQNIPVRIEWFRKLVRSAIKARKGRRLVEVDYKGVEVCGAACYCKDPTLIEYIKDKSKDMHRDTAMEVFFLKDASPEFWLSKMGKKVRYCAKNMFVFPQFYGSWYLDCAKNLWNAIDRLKLTTEDGTPLSKHLRRQGIRKRGACVVGQEPEDDTFEAHVRKIEKRFWRKRFSVYAQWKKDWLALYHKQGWVASKTGFAFQGSMKRNEVINYPVQGASFHFLLWSLIQIQKEIKKRGLKTLLIGQIHDSLLADVPDNELDEFLAICNEVMTVRIRKHWPWINVPLEIDAEVTPIDGCWEEKKSYKIKFKLKPRKSKKTKEKK